MEQAYRTVILSEGGFEVEFANDGKLPKYNPLPTNDEVCRVPGCGKPATTQLGFCTEHNSTENKKAYHKHTKDWVGRLDHEHVPGFSDMLEALIAWAGDDGEKKTVADAFISDIIKTVHARFPDATTLERRRQPGSADSTGPDDVSEAIKALVDADFPDAKFKSMKAQLRGREIPIRILAALLATGVACEEINRGDAWYAKQHGAKVKYANVFMPLAYYFLRRYAGASPAEARMSVKQR